MPAQKTRQLIIERGGALAAMTTGARFAIGFNGSAPVVVGANLAPGMFFLEPDDYIGTKLRIRVTALTNATAPVSDFTVALYKVTAVAGGAAVVNATVAVVPGTSQTVTAPAISSMTRLESPDFDWPSAGWYVFSIDSSANAVASSSVQIHIQLEAR